MNIWQNNPEYIHLEKLGVLKSNSTNALIDETFA